MLHTLTLSALCEELQQGRVSSRELTQHFLNRIEQHDPALNSFITVTAELALQQADQADQRRLKGDAHALTGIPLAHKDTFCTAGIKTSAGSKMLDNFIAPYNATLIEHCEQAGLVMLGKTNQDEFAMGSTNENSFYGPVKNPWHASHCPGGSSGGSAAAVAARLAPAATGTDTGGSVRQPAAFCGLTGIKPTYGSISRFGMIAFASSLDQAGLLAHSAHDCALLLNVVSGHDPKDSTSLPTAADDASRSLQQPIKGLTIGIPSEYLNDACDPAIAEAVAQMANNLQSQGANLVSVSLPHTAYALSCYYIIAPAECSSNLSRYDGVRFGYRCDQPKNLEDCYRRSRSEAFGEEVKRRILTGTYVLSAGYYDAYYRKAQKVRRLIRDDFMQVFQSVDALLTPTTPSTALALNRHCEDANSDQYTTPANLAGLPALSVPCGMSAGLPIGAQLIGPHLSEHRLLQIAHQYQQHSEWHNAIPTPLQQQEIDA